MRPWLRCIAALCALPLLAWIGAANASTLQDVKARGQLKCGVNSGLLGFALKDEQGKWAGFDVDYCKALAAAVLGDAEKVEYVPLSAAQRFDAVKDGKVDVLARNTTWTMGRESGLPLRFVGISYHDGQGFMLKALMGVTSVFNMSSASVCVLEGTTTEQNIADFFKERDMAFTPVVF